MAESQKETDRRMQETDLRLRKLDELFNGQWGKLMESLVEGDLVRLLNQRRIAVDHTITNAKKNYGERRWEFDILAVNGEEVVVVEVKTTLKVDDVDYFVQRLQDFADNHQLPAMAQDEPAQDNRQFTGVGIPVCGRSSKDRVEALRA